MTRIEVDFAALCARMQELKAIRVQPVVMPPLPPPVDLPMMTCNGCARRVVHRFTGYCHVCQGSAWLFKRD